MREAELIDITTICQNFPERPESEIIRENIIDTIDRVFNSFKIVIIEGLEGSGKSTLLSQFTRKHISNTFSLFIKTTHRYLYDPEYIRMVLGEQIHWMLTKEILRDQEIDENYLKTQILKLQRIARSKRETFYFVIDGLCDVPIRDKRISEIVLGEILPIGFNEFRFLIADNSERISECLHRSASCKSYPLTSFSPDETGRYLLDQKLDKETITQIHRMCKGMPGHLAAIRRILLSGVDVQKLIYKESDKLIDFLSIEWDSINFKEDHDKKLLSLITFGRKVYCVSDLSQILNMSHDEVYDSAKRIGFIQIEEKNEGVDFISEAHRKFSEKKLAGLKKEATNVLIDYLTKDTDSNDSLMYLPTYFEQAGRLNELIDYLTPARFVRKIEQDNSLSQVQYMAEIGLKSSKELNKNEALIKFVLQKSIIKELYNSEILHSEIEARIALNDYESALAIVQATVLDVDRLHLLSIIGENRKKMGAELEDELLDQIKITYNKVDKNNLGERAVEIASSLIWIDPDLGIELVESAAKVSKDFQDLDLAFTRLSINTIINNDLEPFSSEIIKKTNSKIKDPKAHEFAEAISMLFGDCSSKELIDRIEKIEEQNKLFILRQWTKVNRSNSDSYEVINYALDLIIKSTLHTPIARDFREIAMPLPSIIDVDKAKNLVGRFDSQMGTIQNCGPSVDYIRLQLILTHSELSYDTLASNNRLIEIYYYISEISDLSIKTECLAWFIAYINGLDPNKELEEKDGLHSLAEDELQSCIKGLLNNTAEHFYDIRGTIRALAKEKPEIAFECIKLINTQHRRDLALNELINYSLKTSLNKINLEIIQKALGEFIDKFMKYKSIMRFIKKLSKNNDKIETDFMKRILPILNEIKDIEDSYTRLLTCCYGFIFLNKQKSEEYCGLKQLLLQTLNNAWESIDVGWFKIDVGFRVAKLLSNELPEIAKEYLRKSDDLRETIILESSDSGLVYKACLKLAIRAYCGLIPGGINRDEDLDRILQSIEKIPSNAERVSLLSELALRHYLNNDNQTLKKIVSRNIRPLIDGIDDLYLKYQVIINSSPAIYLANKLLTKEIINDLPSHLQDETYSEICDFILRKNPLSDPYDMNTNQNYRLSYDDAVEICDILSLMSEDASINMYITILTDCIISKHGSSQLRLTREQKSDIANRLERIINSKLPDCNNIKHNGYKLVGLAKVACIRSSKFDVYDKIIEEASNIPNISDQAFVLSTIASYLPSKFSSKFSELISESESIINKICSDNDKLERYVELAELIHDKDSTNSRKYLKNAMLTSLRNDDSDLVYPAQKRIINLAHKLDTGFAATLSSMIDDDPVRIHNRLKLKEHVGILDLKRKMIDHRKKEINIDETVSNYQYCQAAWMNLGALIAGRIETVHLDLLIPYIIISSELPIRESYPILAWFIENVVIRHSKTDQARTYLSPIFEATLLGAELAGTLATRSIKKLKKIRSYADKTTQKSEDIIIKPGEREKAIKYIKEWLSNKVHEYLIICDAYFGLEDLEILKIVHSINPECSVSIITSKKHQETIDKPLDIAYREHWNFNISNNNPPDTEIIIIGIGTKGQSPIHDRWLLTKSSGLRIGTSFNSLGVNKLSEISLLSSSSALQKESEIRPYLSRTKKEYNSDKIYYTLFTL